MLLLGAAAAAQTANLADRVLVVFNKAEKDSARVADHYIQARGIPKTNRCGIDPPDLGDDNTTAVTWDDYNEAVKPDVRKCLERAGKENILYIVLAYKMPYRVRNVPAGTGEALDDLLADVWDLAAKVQRPLNPYYANMKSKERQLVAFIPFAEFRARPNVPLTYSVWRLDGATREIALGLVDKALAAEKAPPTGKACFDRRYGDDLKAIADNSDEGDWDLLVAAALARTAKFEVVEDTHMEEFGTAPAPLRCDDALLYSGWYSLNHYNDAFTWNTGAIGFHLDSASAADPRGGPNWSANALKQGITVTAGAVDEPYLQGLPRPVGVFFDLFAGANVGDAFARNIRWIRWMVLKIGDPLYRPFPGGKIPMPTRPLSPAQ